MAFGKCLEWEELAPGAFGRIEGKSGTVGVSLKKVSDFINAYVDY